jgi:Glucodextranase, domain B
MKILFGLLLLSSFVCGSQLHSQTVVASPSPEIVTATCGKTVCTWNAFGPATYIRRTGQPVNSTSTLSVLNPNTQYTLHVVSDGVASAVISINGSPVFNPSDFNPGVSSLDRPVSLLSDNTVSVELRSRPGSSLTITIIGVDQDSPSVVETVVPPANAYGWNNTNVEALFACSDSTSGIALCPPSIILTREGLNQVLAGTAFDNAGNSTTASIQISIDKTPPSIVASQAPPPNAFGWNNSPVTVSFACADNLSGVQSCSTPVTVAAEGKDQSATGGGVDFAGNFAESSAKVSIDLTPPVLAVTSPANGSSVTTSSVSVAGTVFDALSGIASVQCNGVAATLSSGGFLCQVGLTPGVNPIQVSAIDNGGNQAQSAISVTSQAAPPIPINAIFITPTTINLLVNQSRSVTVVSDQGVPVSGAAITVGDSSVIQVDSTGQLTAVQPGTTVLTATIGNLAATGTVNVFSGDQLPTGTPRWALAPMPGNFAFDGAFAAGASDGAPSVYWVESGRGFSSLTVRALTADGRQLWATPITTPVVQAAAAAAQVSSTGAHAGGSGGIDNVVPGFSAPLPIASPNLLLASGISDTRDDNTRFYALSRIEERLQSRFPTLEQSRSNALQEVRARLARLNAGQNAEIGQAGNVLASPESLAVPQSTTVPGLSGSYIPLKEVPDSQGGLLLLLLPLDCCNLPETMVRLDPSTQALSWRYDDQSIDSDFAVRDDGTVFLGSSHTITDLTSPLQTSASIVSLDVLTGTLKSRTPLPTQPRDFPLPCSCFQAGPLMIGPDGNAHMTYTTAAVNLVTDQNPQTVTETFTMSMLTLDGAGGVSSDVVQSFSGTSVLLFFDPGAPLQPTHEIVTAVPFPIPGEIIPDSSGGLMIAWTYNLGSGEDCIFFQQFKQCTPTNAPEVDARITHNGFDYILPLETWTNEEGAVFTGNPGGTLVLGENNTALAFNGFKLASFDTNAGSTAWSGLAGSHFFPSTLIGATADGGALLNLNNGKLAQYDAAGNATLSSFLFSFSDIDGLFDLLGVDATGNAALLPAIAPLAQSRWNPRAGIAKQRTEGLLTKDITVVGWINAGGVTFPASSSVSADLLGDLGQHCPTTLGRFLIGDRSLINSDFDRQYANAFLIANSGNHEPPQTLDFNSYLKAGDFRAFNRVQAKLSTQGQQILNAEFLSSRVALGNTVDSCHSVLTPGFLLTPEPHPDNGAKGITGSRLHAFQLNEGRVGASGQAVNMTLNACTSANDAGLCNAPSSPTVPYIWSFPLFDFQAQYTVGHQIFPTYYIYESGKLVNKIGQSALEDFIKLNSRSQVKVSDIQ